MSNDKPINAMYGTKMKLNLDKLKNNSKTDEVSEKSIEVVSKKSIDVSEEVVEDNIKKETPEEIPSKIDSNTIGSLKTKLSKKENKLSNQSQELHYLTNKIIPDLKKENANLNKIKDELTDALEKSTRKYFDQLDINVELSNKIGKIGAEGAVNKVRADKFEAEIESVKEKLQAKINQYKEKLDSINLDELKKENSVLSKNLADVKLELDKAKKDNTGLSNEIKTLRDEIIELGNYKEEVNQQVKKEIEGYKEEISSLTTQLRLKESNYDKLSNESSKTISSLKKQIAKLEEDLEKESNKGLFNRFR